MITVKILYTKTGSFLKERYENIVMMKFKHFLITILFVTFIFPTMLFAEEGDDIRWISFPQLDPSIVEGLKKVMATPAWSDVRSGKDFN